MNHTGICFLGGGNMASSIIGGLIDAGVAPQDITVSEPLEEGRSRLRKRWPIRITDSNIKAVKDADIVILAVKPQVLISVCEEIQAVLPQGVLVLSIAAGLSSEKIDAALGTNRAIVRCMPNTPALVKLGASVLFANEKVSEEQKQIANSILAAVGSVAWIDDEEQMHAVTAVSGSGPAYFFLIIESMVEAGIGLGLDPKFAQQLAIQTALGAASLAKASNDDVAELRRKVTSPGGTTEQAILSFEKHKLRDIFKESMQACALKSQELSQL